MIKNNVEKLLEKNSIYEKMFLMKLHPLRIRVRVVSLLSSGLGIVSKKVKLYYLVKLMLKRRRDWGEKIGVFVVFWINLFNETEISSWLATFQCVSNKKFLVSKCASRLAL